MKLRRDRGALRLAAAALGLLLAQSLVPHLVLAQGMGGMVMPGATTPPVAVPPGGTPAVVTPGLGGGVAPVVPQDPAATAGWPSPVNDSAFNSFLLFDLLEFQRAPNVEAARWDVVGWYGGDTERVWFKSEGRYNGALRTGEMDLQLLYGRLIFPFVDLQAGVRYEQQLSWDNGLPNWNKNSKPPEQHSRTPSTILRSTGRSKRLLETKHRTLMRIINR